MAFVIVTDLTQHSPGVILGNNGKQKSGWPDRELNPGPTEYESRKLPLRHPAWWRCTIRVCTPCSRFGLAVYVASWASAWILCSAARCGHGGLLLKLGPRSSGWAAVGRSLQDRRQSAATVIVTGPVHLVTVAQRWENMLIDAIHVNIICMAAHSASPQQAPALYGVLPRSVSSATSVSVLQQSASEFKEGHPKGLKTKCKDPFNMGTVKDAPSLSLQVEARGQYLMLCQSCVTMTQLRNKCERDRTVFDVKKEDRGKKSTLGEGSVGAVLHTFICSPGKSKYIRQAARESGVCKASVYHISKQIRWRVNIPKLLHTINEDDPDKQVEFCDVVCLPEDLQGHSLTEQWQIILLNKPPAPSREDHTSTRTCHWRAAHILPVPAEEIRDDSTAPASWNSQHLRTRLTPMHFAPPNSSELLFEISIEGLAWPMLFSLCSSTAFFRVGGSHQEDSPTRNTSLLQQPLKTPPPAVTDPSSSFWKTQPPPEVLKTALCPLPPPPPPVTIPVPGSVIPYSNTASFEVGTELELLKLIKLLWRPHPGFQSGSSSSIHTFCTPLLLGPDKRNNSCASHCKSEYSAKHSREGITPQPISLPEPAAVPPPAELLCQPSRRNPHPPSHIKVKSLVVKRVVSVAVDFVLTRQPTRPVLYKGKGPTRH
ncbi:hypothetical protein PR048_017985 [Dryococelus australis]|uniref:Uncharacterized protein n=1 Tax=Dryococelus australis TaxID=614101 RepID=A0ABQ9HAZ7_9NEOP|nr:hypothetical protein PR048_017985 [Dryococelus australis]